MPESELYEASNGLLLHVREALDSAKDHDPEGKARLAADLNFRLKHIRQTPNVRHLNRRIMVELLGMDPRYVERDPDADRAGEGGGGLMAAITRGADRGVRDRDEPVTDHAILLWAESEDEKVPDVFLFTGTLDEVTVHAQRLAALREREWDLAVPQPLPTELTAAEKIDEVKAEIERARQPSMAVNQAAITDHWRGTVERISSILG